mgnify:CR=1 FL=1
MVLIDSFKGSMTSMEAGMAVKAGILAAKKDAEVIVKPLADGGEGTTDALIEGLKGERVDVTVTGAGRQESGTVCDGTDGKTGGGLLRNPCG